MHDAKVKVDSENTRKLAYNEKINDLLFVPSNGRKIWKIYFVITVEFNTRIHAKFN